MASRTYRGPLWKYVHPAKYLKSEARKARFHMRPDRVAWRVFGNGSAKPTLKTETRHVNEQTRRRDVQREQAAAARAAKKAAAKKTAGKRADPYQVAAGIPGQNRALAAQQARARTAQAKKTAPMSDRALRGKGGKLAGSRPALSPDDEQLYRQARQGYVDPVLLPRSPRRRT